MSDYLTASGRFPERAKSGELSDEYITNANNLLTRVNALLQEIGIKQVKVSSGFRPTSANKAAGGAKKSSHTTCNAIDIEDLGNRIGKLVVARPDLLRKHNLFVEDLKWTPSWLHIDQANRKDRPSRTFIP
jgi:hypothetical protein